LAIGLTLAVVVILLLLTANFQSFRLALVVISSVPAVLVGAILMLLLTGTTLNLESFMGTIMAIGVAIANAILLVTFAEQNRRNGSESVSAARAAAAEQSRPVPMTSLAMIAGMLPMALAIGEGSEETAPLGRAVIGGLIAATLATLFLLPTVFGIVQRRASLGGPRLSILKTPIVRSLRSRRLLDEDVPDCLCAFAIDFGLQRKSKTRRRQTH
jgi:multidrug efflux pump subunit AcrB